MTTQQKLWCVVAILLAISIPSIARSDEPASTPESALRHFLIAVTMCDMASIKSVSLPDPDLKLLTIGDRPAEEEIPDMKKFFASVPMRRLKLGEKS